MPKEKKRLLTTCQVCKKEFHESDLGDGVWYNYGEQHYNYRGFDSCEGCYDNLIEKVDYKRQGIIEDFDNRSLVKHGVSVMKEAYPGDKLAEYHNALIKPQTEVASNPSWVEENEYRKGKL